MRHDKATEGRLDKAGPKCYREDVRGARRFEADDLFRFLDSQSRDMRDFLRWKVVREWLVE